MTSRLPYLDNAKSVLIILVVFGHLIEPLRFYDGYRQFYTFVYSFHMPAFIMIAGVFSKAALSKENYRKILSDIFIPLLFFTVLYEAVYFALFNEPSKYLERIAPHWILWFLWSLMIWRMILPVIEALQPPPVLVVSVSIAASFLVSAIEFPGQFLGIYRLFVFMPFFLCGYYMKNIFLSPDSVNLAKVARITLPFALICAAVIAPYTGFKLLWANYGFHEIEGPLWMIVFARCILYLLGIIVSCLLIFAMPRQRTFLAKTGAATLSVFLWHGLAVYMLRKTGLYAYPEQFDAVLAIPVFMGLAVFMAFIFSARFFIVKFRP